MENPDLRIGDTERDDATRLLQEHLAAGRLDHEEFSSRVESALGATHRSQLDGLFGDLPGRRPGQPVPAAVAPAGRTVATRADSWRPWALGGLAMTGLFSGMGLMHEVIGGPMGHHGPGGPRGHHGAPELAAAHPGVPWHGVPWFGLLVLLLVAGVVAFAVARRVRHRATPAGARSRTGTLTSAQREAIDRELAAGHRVAAIRLFRAATGASLAEAALAVQGWQRRSAAWRA